MLDAAWLDECGPKYAGMRRYTYLVVMQWPRASRAEDTRKRNTQPISPSRRERARALDLLDHPPPLMPSQTQRHKTAGQPLSAQAQSNHHGMDSQFFYLRRSNSPCSSSIICCRPSLSTARARRLPREPDRTRCHVQAFAPRCQECGPSSGPSARVRSSFAGGLARDPPNARTFADAASRAWVCGGTKQRYVFLSMVEKGWRSSRQSSL